MLRLTGPKIKLHSNNALYIKKIDFFIKIQRDITHAVQNVRTQALVSKVYNLSACVKGERGLRKKPWLS